ncbi:hypothetical protein [Okeania hirsuta]|uniref:hypothetical protein n=1 Tax=Okeania hirsuta TaxID=1458930 RepID=UPI000F51DD61|nr:hypothetical protein [Okeania hirsuta]
MAVQEIEKELEQEYKRFIEFGNLLDRRRRTYIIQYLQNKFDPHKHIIPSLKEQYYEYFQLRSTRSAERLLLAHTGLGTIVRAAPLLSGVRLWLFPKSFPYQ